jgi:hypothetical protein
MTIETTHVEDSKGISKVAIDPSDGALGSAKCLRWTYHTYEEMWVGFGLLLQGTWRQPFDLSPYDSVSFYAKGNRPGSSGFSVHAETVRDGDEPWVMHGFDYTTEWKKVTIELEPEKLATLNLRKVYQFGFGDFGHESPDVNVLWIDEITCRQKPASGEVPR